jgi:hypothetical protein
MILASGSARIGRALLTVGDRGILGARGLSFLCLLASLFPIPRSGLILRLSPEINFDSAPTNRPDSRTVAIDRPFYHSGTEFLHVCSAEIRVEHGGQSARDAADALACESYVAGVADGVAVQHIWSRSHGDQTVAAFCKQFEDVPASRIVEAVLQYLRENPDRGRFRASIAVEEVLHKKFPCK